MKKLSGPERVMRARRKRDWLYRIQYMAGDIWNMVTTALMYVGIGGCIGVGCGFGMAVVVAII